MNQEYLHYIYYQLLFQHIAVVKGSSGTVTGLVTLEDLIESIIGDIYDEYELLPEHIITVTENRHLVGGGVRLKKLRERLSLDLPDTEEKVADWLAARAGADIAAETRIVCGGYEFIVRKVKKGKINEVILQR